MDKNKKDEIKVTLVIGVLMLIFVMITGCSATPKATPVNLSCYAEKTHDFIKSQGAYSYWAELVTEETLNSCRQHSYQKHTAYLTPEQIKQANEWITSRVNNND